MPRLLRFRDVEPNRAFHAALADSTTTPHPRETHTHDFVEAFFVVQGSGWHVLPDRRLPLQEGEVTLVRPSDVHTFAVGPRVRLAFINVAFALASWEQALDLAGLVPDWQRALTQPDPPSTPADLEPAFRHALAAFARGGEAVDLFAFLAALLPLLTERPDPTPLPPWLAHATEAMARERNLALGVPRLTELACVSPAHLSRTFRAYFGTTPTEWVNARRLERAADLLRTTQDPIAAIALRCGFENLPYFYRRFTAHYKTTPLAHRQEAPQRVLRSTGNPPKGDGAPWSEAEGGTEGEGVAANGGKRPSPEESIKRSPENHSR